MRKPNFAALRTRSAEWSMMVTLEPPVSSICAAIWPKREKPIISTSAPAPSKFSSSCSATSATRKKRVAGTNSGVIAIDSVTMAISSDAVSSGKIGGGSRGREQHEGELAALRQQAARCGSRSRGVQPNSRQIA